MSTVELRDYQTNAIARVRDAYGRRYTRPLLVSPTGSGKTTIAAKIIELSVAKGKRVIFAAHRKELIDQCSARLTKLGVQHGVIMADHPRFMPWLPVQVVSVPTIRARMGKSKLPEADLLIIDEAHHARAQSYAALFEAYPQALVLGLTATPWRSDNRGLGEVFDSIVLVAKPADLIARGFLVPIVGYAYSRPDLSHVETVGSDYDQGQLGKVMADVQLLGSVVSEWEKHASHLRTVVFAVHVAHSMEMVEAFRARGIAAEHLDGETPKDQREGILARLAAGTTRVVSNCGVLTEGWDCPNVGCAILARPTKSLALYLQMAGRALRPVCLDCDSAVDWRVPVCPACGSTNIKREARIHDHAGAAFEFGLPDAERDYVLENDVVRRKTTASTAPSVRTCEACFAIYEPGLPACPRCGFVPPLKLKTVGEVAGEAVPLDKVRARVVTSEENRRKDYDFYLRTAKQKGYQPGWARHRYRAKFQLEPPRGWLEDFVARNGPFPPRPDEPT